jgi:hypothetical protein
VAFYSFAVNLVPGDSNGVGDVFIRDRQNGTTERVSVSSGGAQANGQSQGGSLSGDGRYVTIWSEATNLVSGDTNGFRDVFVRDRQNGVTERVSLSSAGPQGNDDSLGGAVSADGRYVAFSPRTRTSRVTPSSATIGGAAYTSQGDLDQRRHLPLCEPAATRSGCDNPPVREAPGGGGGSYLWSDSLVFSATERSRRRRHRAQGSASVASARLRPARCVAGTLKRLFVKTAVVAASPLRTVLATRPCRRSRPRA